MAQNPDSSSPLTIRVAHSPDADDRFMFWPLREGLVKSPGLHFEFAEADTQTLNQWAQTHAPEICAVSAIHYGRVWQTYQPLRMGASVGDNYGPVLVARKSWWDWAQREFGTGAEGIEAACRASLLLTPGDKTTAHAVLQLLNWRFGASEQVAITPMTKVFDRLEALEAQGRQACALLIHEGRLMYQNLGCQRLCDIGEAWKVRTGGSLPLGLNVIARHLAPELKATLSELCTRSCAYAMAHRDTYFELASTPDSPYFSPLSKTDLAHYLDLYANATTASILPTDQISFETLITQAAAAGLLEQGPKARGPVVDWI